MRRSATPKDLREKYALENLYVEDLPDFCGMLCTGAKQGGNRIIVVVDIVDHKAISRGFSGRRR